MYAFAKNIYKNTDNISASRDLPLACNASKYLVVFLGSVGEPFLGSVGEPFPGGNKRNPKLALFHVHVRIFLIGKGWVKPT